MKIKVQSIWGAEPQMCLDNVEKRIRACGGNKVFGWKIKDIQCGWKIRENHCVWENPAGVLFDVTPEFADVAGGFAIAEWGDECEFERDDSSTFEGKNRRSIYPTQRQPTLEECRRICAAWRHGDERRRSTALPLLDGQS